MASKFTSCGIRTNLVCPGGVRDKKNKLQNNSFLKIIPKDVQSEDLLHLMKLQMFYCS